MSNDDQRFDPWAPHDPWGDLGDGIDRQRLPGLRGYHLPVGREVPLSEMEGAHTSCDPASSQVPTQQHVAETAVLRLVLTTSDGVPVSEIALVVTQTGGTFEQTAKTDARGAVTIDVPEEGPYDVRFEVVPPKLPARPATAVAEPAPWLARDTQLVRASAGREHRLVLVRPACTEVLFDGWAQGAKVMRWGGMRPRLDGTVATARGALRLALQRARGRTMVVGGHADPLGTDMANDAIAAERATSVHLFLSGDLQSWAEHAAVHATKLDVQCALVACHVALGLGACALDNDDALALVLSEIRSRANATAHAEGGAERSDDAPFGVDDWKVVADVYDLDLAIFMGTDRAGLGETRARVAWTDAPVVSLGERHPRPAVELADVVELPALSHRRVSLLVFGKHDGAQTAVDGGGDEIYDGTYTRTVVPVPGEVLVQIRVTTPNKEAIAKGRAWIAVGDLELAEHTAHADGVIRFLTLCGDRIAVIAAFDGSGSGTMISAEVETL